MREGLTERAASEVGLSPGSAVGGSIIDEHAEVLGVLGGVWWAKSLSAERLEERRALSSRWYFQLASHHLDSTAQPSQRAPTPAAVAGGES